MIDIHCHLLYQVDDGARTREESAAMLQEAAYQGIKAIIMTPHLRHGMFPYDKDAIEEHFAELLPWARMLGIRIFLGTEYHVNSDMTAAFTGGKCHTLADSRYILTEYETDSGFSYAMQMTQEALRFGYIPVIAHAERYMFVMDDIGSVATLREMGALVQVNADSVLGIEGRASKKLCRELLREDLVDVIASDSHGIKERTCHMKPCYHYVRKKYGEARAKELFINVPEQIINGG